MVIEVQNVPDRVVELLVTRVFQVGDLKSPLDQSLRASLTKELRRRKTAPAREEKWGSQNGLFVEGREIFLAWIPELRPLESLAAAFSLVDKTIKTDRMAVGAFASGDRESYTWLIGCVVFLTDVSLKLAEQTHTMIAREKRRWN
jgi:hypothetical protein